MLACFFLFKGTEGIATSRCKTLANFDCQRLGCYIYSDIAQPSGLIYMQAFVSLMKAFSYLCAFLLLAASALRADESLKPVMNAVKFSGDYVTFSEAKPKFRPVHQEQPIYPEELLQKRIAGFAIVAFLVELDGATAQCQVVEASDAAFGEAARAAIALWKFSPPQFGGTPGPIAMSFPVEFTVPAQVAMESSAAAKPEAGSGS